MEGFVSKFNLIGASYAYVAKQPGHAKRWLSPSIETRRQALFMLIHQDFECQTNLPLMVGLEIGT